MLVNFMLNFMLPDFSFVAWLCSLTHFGLSIVFFILQISSLCCFVSSLYKNLEVVLGLCTHDFSRNKLVSFSWQRFGFCHLKKFTLKGFAVPSRYHLHISG
jgi:hypothetical protein